MGISPLSSPEKKNQLKFSESTISLSKKSDFENAKKAFSQQILVGFVHKTQLFLKQQPKKQKLQPALAAKRVGPAAKAAQPGNLELSFPSHTIRSRWLLCYISPVGST